MGDGVADYGPFERDLGKLPGVKHARIVVDKARITEVHIVSDGLKDVRQLKRDIETLGKAAHNIDLDHRVISISALPDVDIRATTHRFELESVGVSTASGIATANVSVNRAGETGEGVESGAATTAGLPKLVARTTIRAASAIAGYQLPAEAANALIVPVDELRVATVVLIFVDDDGTEVAVGGSHPARGDHNEAIARATLDAINRHLM